ncbi:hypothetical protein GWI33_013337 [Rhynchophorus ferrugineus]|uniref:Uncharacterized protein n=1 Tax=Rhynchophorus ferrugineus TaxID=354439 RepID=A0A834I8F1_RHYFE|nr:hypothetical protein GWI33_013337 [Rhynchophorus ferrugineus]
MKFLKTKSCRFLLRNTRRFSFRMDPANPSNQSPKLDTGPVFAAAFYFPSWFITAISIHRLDYFLSAPKEGGFMKRGDKLKKFFLPFIDQVHWLPRGILLVYEQKNSLRTYSHLYRFHM